MGVISEHDLAILEFDTLLQELAAFCHYSENRNFALNIRPLADRQAIELQQKLTADALSLLLRRGSLPLTGLNVIKPYLKRAELDAVLDCSELYAVMTFLRALRRLREWVNVELSEDVAVAARVEEFKAVFKVARQVLSTYEFMSLPDDFNAITLLLACLPEQESLLQALERAILDENALSDNASGKLAKIRQSIMVTRNKVKVSLEKLIKSKNSALQDTIITQRNNRFVVPVKAAFRQQIPGLVHDSSASSQTLFVEPAEVVELNNEIRELELEEAKEIKRILFELSQELKKAAEPLFLACNEIRLIDFAIAKAELARKYKAVKPEFGAAALRLSQARHPLLDPKKVVPLDLALDDDILQLLITGPNTGGKTICLKTIALLQVMAQSGLHIPANADSKLKIYSKIMVDIGDEQSVKLNLSTFSAHMRKIITILENVDSESLVILDELGSGTDPSEGAALARAVLETLLAKGAATFASTHYRELKIYALEKPGVENAACEFDSVSMLPTYRLLVKAAGVSNAFTISENLGLNHDIIALAQTYLTNENLNFDRALTEVESQNQLNRRLQLELQDKVAAVERKLQEAEVEKRKLQERKQNLQAELLQENKKAYADNLLEIEQLLQELRDSAERFKGAEPTDDKSALAYNYEVANLLKQELKSKLRQVEDSIAEQTFNELFSYENKPEHVGNLPVKAVGEIVQGAYYTAPQLNLQGQAVAVDSAKGQVTLKNKNMQIQVPAVGLIKLDESDLSKEILQGSDKIKHKYKEKLSVKMRGGGTGKEENYFQAAAQAGKDMATELNIIGARYSDAEQLVDQYLDQAVLSGTKQVRIVHGKGSGILRNMVRELAKHDKRIKSYRQGEYGEGDAGVTVLQLK